MPIYIVSLAILGPTLLVLHLLSVTLARALRSYSRSRFEALCAREGRPELADEVAHLDEATEGASELLAVMTGLMLAALLGVTVDRLAPAFAVESVLGIALAVGSVGYVLSGVTGRVYAEQVLVYLWPASAALRWTLFPLTWLYKLAERGVGRLADSDGSSPRPASVEVEIPAHEVEPGEDIEADLPEAARVLLRQAVALTHRDVSELMTPRARLVWLPATISARSAAQRFHDSGMSRIPLFGEHHDDIVGVLFAKDLFAESTRVGLDQVVVRRLARRSFCVPVTKSAFDLLGEFRAGRTQIAMVLDEYGCVAGVVTLEDLLEELVGDIDDEHDVPTPDDLVASLGDGRYHVDAAVLVEDLNQRLGLHLPTDEGYHTIGGLAFSTLGRVPEPGATFQSHGVAFRVAEVAEHAIRRLIVELQTPTPLGNP